MSIAQTLAGWPQGHRETNDGAGPAPTVEACVTALRAALRHGESAPFSVDDVTAGAENELQVAVRGSRAAVDLPRQIASSRYLQNLTRTGRRHCRDRLRQLERYLSDNPDQIWENSWVTFPASALHPSTEQVFLNDLRAQRGNPDSPFRSDSERFLHRAGGDIMLRLPVSYLLKLALVDACHHAPEPIAGAGRRYAEHFLSDNTSPETFSFHPVRAGDDVTIGQAMADETARRFLLTQLLVRYANERFGLLRQGQEVMVFNSPNPPVRQRVLNGCISDSYYRELFMSPCLSGWDRGEEKQRYMGLCHEALSRSRLNTVRRLKDAGIIVNNLVVLPHTSHVCLSNNGMHVSLGSDRLSRALADPHSGFTARHEKRLGDLVIKVAEHFLPLFVGSYSAAPYRLDFADFHPEEVLGFLPHELGTRHLRMVWQRWKAKARNQVFGVPLTPFGPVWLDSLLGRLFALRGDAVPDHRLIDYLVALASTEGSPALDGRTGNDERLKHDLAALGVFDERMAFYQPVKLRHQSVHGFSGFEYRPYSLFPAFRGDLAPAVDMQHLVTQTAFRRILAGTLTHDDIPDTPFVESERRQIFFAAAIGLPGFYVRNDRTSPYLRRILDRTHGIQPSRRHPGFAYVPMHAYRMALIDTLQRDACGLMDDRRLSALLEDLRDRLAPNATSSSAARLTRSVLDELGARSPFRVDAQRFNGALERYCREDLLDAQLEEALARLLQDVRALDRRADTGSTVWNEALRALAGPSGIEQTVGPAVAALRRNASPADAIAQLIHVVLLVAAAGERPSNAPA